MQKASRNQLANTRNEFQGPAKKVLCVCSAGLLRSPTMAHVLANRMGYNTRACGTSQEYALIPVTEALLFWADEIHVVKEQHRVVLSYLAEANLERDVVVYDLPDDFERNDPELIRLINLEIDNFGA